MTIRTPTTGWKGAVYVAADGPPTSIDDPGWKKVATIDQATSATSVDLDTAGQAYRYYLVWITDLGDNNRVQLAEIELFRAAR